MGRNNRQEADELVGLIGICPVRAHIDDKNKA